MLHAVSLKKTPHHGELHSVAKHGVLLSWNGEERVRIEQIDVQVPGYLQLTHCTIFEGFLFPLKYKIFRINVPYCFLGSCRMMHSNWRHAFPFYFCILAHANQSILGVFKLLVVAVLMPGTLVECHYSCSLLHVHVIFPKKNIFSFLSTSKLRLRSWKLTFSKTSSSTFVFSVYI